MHMHGAAIKRAPPPPRATFIPNTDMPFRRSAKTSNNNGQESFYIVRRAASTGMHAKNEENMGQIIYFIEGRSLSRHKLRFCTQQGAFMEHFLQQSAKLRLW